MVKNQLKKLIDAQGITPYQFWKSTNLNKITAYRLYNDSSYIPGREVMEVIGDVYGWHPKYYIDYVPNNVAQVVDNN